MVGSGKGGCDGFQPGFCRDWYPSTAYLCHWSLCTRLLEGRAPAVTHSERPVAPHTHTHTKTHTRTAEGREEQSLFYIYTSNSTTKTILGFARLIV